MPLYVSVGARLIRQEVLGLYDPRDRGERIGWTTVRREEDRCEMFRINIYRQLSIECSAKDRKAQGTAGARRLLDAPIHNAHPA